MIVCPNYLECVFCKVLEPRVAEDRLELKFILQIEIIQIQVLSA